MPTLTPSWSATDLIERLSDRSRAISAELTLSFGLPSVFPLARALRMPDLTHSAIKVRSSSATAPRTVKIILPVGVLVSICSENEMNSMPSALNVSKPAQQMRHAPRKPVELPHHYRIKPTLVRVNHEPV